jgi:hypothetical protein
MLVGYDRFLLSLDGWVAVVRTDPYKVEWRSPDGRWRSGPIIERSVIVDDRIKAEVLAGRARSTGPVRYRWPERMPSFLGASDMFVTRTGEVVVQRLSSRGVLSKVYDVFNRDGIRAYQVSLASDQRFLGFGVGAVYVATTDSVGIQTVSRHRWPLLAR